MARQLYPRLEVGWLLLADRVVDCWQGWPAAPAHDLRGPGRILRSGGRS